MSDFYFRYFATRRALCALATCDLRFWGGSSMGITRREFVKGSIVAGAAITVVPTILVRKSPADWAKKTIVHPNVNNLRVVGITDPRMTRHKEVETSWKRHKELVVSDPGWDNMD